MRHDNHIYLTIRLPIAELTIIEEVAKIAELKAGDVCNVLIAFGIVRERMLGRLPPTTYAADGQPGPQPPEAPATSRRSQPHAKRVPKPRAPNRRKPTR